MHDRKAGTLLTGTPRGRRGSGQGCLTLAVPHPTRVFAHLPESLAARPFPPGYCVAIYKPQTVHALDRHSKTVVSWLGA